MFSLAKVRFVKIAILFTSLILCLLPPRELRENTEGTPTQLPANKKCCLLIFAISIGCLVLAAIPASSLPVTLVYLVLPSHLAVLCSRFRPREIPAFLCPLSRKYSGYPCVPPPVMLLPVVWQITSSLSSHLVPRLLLCSRGSVREILLAFTPYTLHLTQQLCCLSPPLTSKLYLRCLSLHPTL